MVEWLHSERVSARYTRAVREPSWDTKLRLWPPSGSLQLGSVMQSTGGPGSGSGGPAPSVVVQKQRRPPLCSGYLPRCASFPLNSACLVPFRKTPQSVYVSGKSCNKLLPKTPHQAFQAGLPTSARGKSAPPSLAFLSGPSPSHSTDIHSFAVFH